MYFDFHTHRKKDNKTAIINRRMGIDLEVFNESTWFSAGIHPWDLGKIDLEVEYKNLKNSLLNKYCVALGELGLDKVFGTNLVFQKKVFRDQLSLAQECQTKVLIIHCVKAYQEIIEEKKNNTSDFYWVLHGFNGEKQLIEQLVKHGFYFSLGSALLVPETKIAKNAASIPLHRLFLETDDTDISIVELYQKASEVFGMDLKEFEKQIKMNLTSLFGKDFRKGF